MEVADIFKMADHFSMEEFGGTVFLPHFLTVSLQMHTPKLSTYPATIKNVTF